MAERVKRLEKSIVEVIEFAPASMQEVIRGLQALRGITHISAVTIAVELGNITSRFERARDHARRHCGSKGVSCALFVTTVLPNRVSAI